MIQFRHRNCDKAFTPATFAFILPPISFFMDMIVHGESIINFPFALTKVHPKDQYCRATGRSKSEEALHRSASQTFHCTNLQLSERRVFYNLVCDELAITCSISCDFKNSKVRMEWIDFA